MALNIDFKQDVLDIFLQTAPWTEDIIYTPAGEASRNVKAMVVRDGSLTSSPFSRTGNDNASKERLWEVVVYLPRDDTIGVTKITLMTDSIEYKKHIGSISTNTKQIAGILLENDGFVLVGLK